MEKGTQRTKLNWLNLPEVIVFVICVYSFWASVLILKSLSALGDFNDERILKAQKTKVLDRVLEVSVPDEIYQTLLELI